ncbi:MAG: filamentous hemagglutinin N-terminal domain-containing protein [Gammaproteobacteria bacterium]|nr:filamentous hemagglutinin N-terminal domain-containing protein [Gammaproteobacteria bacterium]
MHRRTIRNFAPRRTLCSRLVAGALGLFCSTGALANPQGGQVVSGSAQFATPNATTLEISNSPNAIINWNSFSIGQHETTRFLQESAASAVLNRVTGGDPSEILGQMVSNGRVFLLNPNGVLIGQNATIDTAGLIMSTLDIANEDFLAGKLAFSGDDSSGGIVNHGYIKAGPGGEIVLLAPSITNAPVDGNDLSGILETDGGQLILAAGRAITITSLDNAEISFEVQAPTDAVVNLGALLAKGGTAAVLAGTIHHSGEINADNISVDATGRIVLGATSELTVAAGSTISAAGGRIEISATNSDGDAIAAVSGMVTTSDTTTGGVVSITGDTVALSGATVSADAVDGNAGIVQVGGSAQGTALALDSATTVTVDSASTVSASAQRSGDGGEVVVYASADVDFAGTALARGGLAAGDGGYIEVSGTGDVLFSGTVDVGAPGGTPGSLLLDPKFIFIIPGQVVDGPFQDPTPFAGDGFGGNGLSVLSNGNILILNQNADATGATDAGEVFLFGPAGNLLGSITGTANSQRLGAFGFRNMSSGDVLIADPNATVGANTLAGTLHLLDGTTGQVVGQLNGGAANDQLGLSFFSEVAYGSFGQAPTGKMIVNNPRADVGGLVDAGTSFLVSEADLSITGQLNGQHTGDALGNVFPTMLNNGNYVITARNADAGGITDAGSLFVVDGSTGTAAFQLDGNTASEFLGNSVDTFTLGNSVVIVRNAQHSNGAGAVFFLSSAGSVINSVVGATAGDGVGSFGLTNLGSVLALLVPDADVGGNVDAGQIYFLDRNIATAGQVLGRIDGSAADDSVGQLSVTLLPSGNVLVPVPYADVGGNIDAGRVMIVSPTTTNNPLLNITGDTAFENLGFDIDRFTLGTAFPIIISAAHGNDTGAIFFTDDGGNLLNTVTGSASGDRLGDWGVDYYGGSELVIAVPDASPNGTSGGGEIRFVDRTIATVGQELGRISGVSDFEQLGSESITRLSNGNYLVASPFASTQGLSENGRVFITAPTATDSPLFELAGDTDFENLGFDLQPFEISIDTPVLISDQHGGGVGEIFFIDAINGAVINSVAGDANGDMAAQSLEHFGSEILLRLPLADAANFTDAGRIIFLSSDPATLGQELGRIEGISTNSRLGSYFPIQLTNGDYVIKEPNASIGGLTNVGRFMIVDPNTTNAPTVTVVGDTAGELLGSDYDEFSYGDSRPIIFSPQHGGGAGAIYFIDGLNSTVASISGNTGDLLGNGPYDVLPGGNLYIGVPDAGPNNEGQVMIIDPATATDLTGGLLVGNAANERMGASFSDFDTFTLGFTDNFIVKSDLHGTDQGALFFVNGADGSFQTFNGSAGDFLGRGQLFGLSNGNIVVTVPDAGTNASGKVLLLNPTSMTELTGGLLVGNTANERLGTSGNVNTFTLGGNNFLVTNTQHGSQAGAMFFVDGSTGTFNLLQGENPGDLLGQFGLSQPFGATNYLVRVPAADPNGLVDAGTLFFIDATGGIVGRVDGSAAGDNLGQSINEFTVSGSVLAFVPNADVGLLTDAGSLLQIDRATATVVQRIDGTSAGERFGASTSLYNIGAGRYLIPSTLADVGGATDAGRFVLFDPSATGGNQSTDFTFSGNPNGSLTLTNLQIQDFLNGGASLSLEANTDIVTSVGADINATGGSLSLRAGRSILINSNISVPSLTLAANLTATDGVVSTSRDPGPGEIWLLGALLGGNSISVGGENIYLQPTLVNGVATVSGITAQGALNLSATGDVVIDGAAVSGGTLDVTATNIMFSTLNFNGADFESGVSSAGAIAMTASGDIALVGSTVAGGSVDIEAANVYLDGLDLNGVGYAARVNTQNDLTINSPGDVLLIGGNAIGAFAELNAGGRLTVNAANFGMYGGTALDVPPGTRVIDIFDNFQLAESINTTQLPPIALVYAGGELTVNATESVTLQAGGSADAGVLLIGSDVITVHAPLMALLTSDPNAPSDPTLNADALIVSLGGIPPAIEVADCVGCEDLFGDPLGDGTGQGGIYVVGGIQDDSTTDAIIAAATSAAEETHETADEAIADEDDDDEDEEEQGAVGECS